MSSDVQTAIPDALGASFQKRPEQDWRDYFKFEREKYYDDERRRKYAEERQEEQDKQDRRRRGREETRAWNQRAKEYRESTAAESKRRRPQKSGGGRDLPPNGNPPARPEVIVASARIVPAAEPQIDATVPERKGYLSADERERFAGLPVPISAEYRDAVCTCITAYSSATGNDLPKQCKSGGSFGGRIGRRRSYYLGMA
jgi:hypothetical protein